MNSHDLAKLLLSLPNLPVVIYANSYTDNDEDLRVGKLQYCTDEKIIIGYFIPPTQRFFAHTSLGMFIY